VKTHGYGQLFHRLYSDFFFRIGGDYDLYSADVVYANHDVGKHDPIEMNNPWL
jgi:hypothetical protein